MTYVPLAFAVLATTSLPNALAVERKTGSHNPKQSKPRLYLADAKAVDAPGKPQNGAAQGDAKPANSELEPAAQIIKNALQEPGVQVSVVERAGRRVAIISGTAKTPADVEAAAGKFKPVLVDEIIAVVRETSEPSYAEEIVREEVELRFNTSKVDSTLEEDPAPTPAPATQSNKDNKDKNSQAPEAGAAGGGSGGNGNDRSVVTEPKPDSIDLWIQAVNSAYGRTADKPLIKRIGTTSSLLLQGTRTEVTAIKKRILLRDALWPQVRVDMYAVQASGNPKEVATEMTRLHRRLRLARSAMLYSQGLIMMAAQGADLSDGRVSHYKYIGGKGEANTVDDLFNRENGPLAAIGFDPNNKRPLTLSESLVFLAMSKDGKAKLEAIARGAIESALRNQSDPYHRVITDSIHEDYYIQGGKTPTFKPFWRLLTVFNANREANLQGVVDFTVALKDLHEFDPADVAPGRDPLDAYSKARDTADAMISRAMNAYIMDMQEMFLRPILEDITARTSQRTKSGAALTGQAHFVVTSRMQTKLKPSVVSYVNTTRPKPIELGDIAGFLGIGGSGGDSGGSGGSGDSAAGTNKASGTQDGTAAGGSGGGSGGSGNSGGSGGSGLAVGQVFSSLTPWQQILAGLLLKQPEPEITKVAPGFAINMRPTVHPDGDSARLQMDFNFGVKSLEQFNQSQPDGTIKSIPADAIVRHHSNPDVSVTAFDLFPVSSFTLQSSYPRSRYLPVIGSIPLLGEIFKRPAKNKVSHHESIVIVNAAILPRATDMARFYGY